MKVLKASWSSGDGRWTVEARNEATGRKQRFTAGYLIAGTGYYDYDQGYRPQFPGEDRVGGPVVHPQHWPEDLDYAGRRVLIIGSGATAITLVPAMAPDAEHVTMLQRSPSYVLALPGQDPIANLLRKVLPAKVAYPIVRWKNVALATMVFQLSRRVPDFVRKLIRKQVERQVPAGYDVDTHFNPRYDPWDQRLCLVPDGDLFRALSDGSASVATDS